MLDGLSSTPPRADRRPPRIDAPLTHFRSPRGEKCGLVRAYERQFNPQTPIESDLVFQLAATQYRMRRALRFESSIFDFHVNERIGHLARHGDPVDIDALVTETVTVDASHSNALSKVSLYENRLARRYEHTRKQLEQIQNLSKEQIKISKTNPIGDFGDSTLIIVD